MYNATNSLYHHGIKGQRWGIRRFQKKDGSLTSAGKKRYSDSGDGKTKSKKSSVHRTHLEKNYIERGMTKAEAKAAAAKRIKIEKAIAITAGVTVAAATAYYMRNKWISNHCDQILKAGTTFHNLDAVANPRPGEHLYVNYRKDDTHYFKGHFAVNKMRKNGHVFDHSITATGDVKIPSLNTRKSVFKQLFDNDEEFRSVFNTHAGLSKTQDKSKRTYKKMWQLFGDKDTPEFNVAKRKYFDALKQKGYDAIVDEWDTNPRVFRSNAPLILLDTSSKSLGEMKISELSKLDILTSQANSKSWIGKRDWKNYVTNGHFHTNHFNESARLLSKYSDKDTKNRANISKVINALSDVDRDVTIDSALRKRNGSVLAKAGDYMTKNSSMSVNDAIKKAQKRNDLIEAADTMTKLAGPALVGSYAANNYKIEKYLKEHPNSKLNDREILELLKK